MNNFKDYNNMSLNMHDNAYAMFLRQQELNKVLLEKKLAKEKKDQKKADKDYDGDGEVETGSEEFLGSRDKAIKANMAKKNDKSKKPAKKVEKKKKKLNEGTEVQAGDFVYGGFPKILNEVEIRLAKGNANPDEEPELAERPDEHATDGFNDANDGPGKPGVATMTDAEEVLWSDPSLVHRGYRYPSKALMGLAQQAETIQQQYLSQRRSSPNFETSPAGKALGRQAYQAQMQLYRHPHFTEFQQGHPSKRNKPIQSDIGSYGPGTVIDSSREGT